MYLQGQKKSPISGKSLGLGFFSLRESFHFLVWLCSLGLRPRLHNCQTAKFIPWSDCVASASGLGYTTVRPRNENFLSRKRNPGRELFHLWSTCFRPYRTFIPFCCVVFLWATIWPVQKNQAGIDSNLLCWLATWQLKMTINVVNHIFCNFWYFIRQKCLFLWTYFFIFIWKLILVVKQSKSL